MFSPHYTHLASTCIWKGGWQARPLVKSNMNKKIHTVTHDFLKGSFKQLNYKDAVLSQATGSEIRNLTLQPGSSFDWKQDAGQQWNTFNCDDRKKSCAQLNNEEQHLVRHVNKEIPPDLWNIQSGVSGLLLSPRQRQKNVRKTTLDWLQHRCDFAFLWISWELKMWADN